MIISMAYPGRYMRLFYIALVGLLIFDFAFYPFAAHAQSRRTLRQGEENPERQSPRPFTTPVPEESEKEVTPPVKIKSIGKRPTMRLFARVAILSGRVMFLPWL